ncbi:unnamed protein product [Hymenolepis diminuta]|uniref:DUF4536 domain-containing protein n=2 Tax=Hymenolepis diminuta TaxID=6216 RepID=A0A564YZ96_HYMDI|nr:unnamed protein product [Hymenolepis diminuta]
MSSTGKSCELQKKNPRDLLEAQDCVACRIFGSTACLAMAGYTAYWSYRQRAQYKGPIRVIYLASCIGLASGLTYLGVKRIFD